MTRFLRLTPALLLLAAAACGGAAAPQQGEKQDIPDVSMGLFNPGGNHVVYDGTGGSKLTLVFGNPEQQGLLEEVHLSKGASRRGYHFYRFPKDGKVAFEVTEMTEAQTLLRHTMEIKNDTTSVLKLSTGTGPTTDVTLAVIPAPAGRNVKTLFTATFGENRIMEMGIADAVPSISPYFLAVFFLMGQWARQDLTVGSLVMNWVADLGLTTFHIAGDKGQIDLQPMSRKEKDENGDERYVFSSLKKSVGGVLEETASFSRRDDGQIMKIAISDAAGVQKTAWTRSTASPWTVEQGRLVLRSLDLVLGWDPTDDEKKRLTELGQNFARSLFEAFDGQASIREIVFYSKKAGRNPTQPGVIWIGKSFDDVKNIDPYARYCMDTEQKRAGVLAYTYASNPLHGNPMYTSLDRLDLARKVSPVGDGIVLLHEFMHSYWGLDEEYANAAGDASKGACPLASLDRSKYKACVMDNKFQPELCRAKFHASDTRQQKVRETDCATYVTRQASKYLKFDLVFGDTPKLGDAARAPQTTITFK